MQLQTERLRIRPTTDDEQALAAATLGQPTEPRGARTLTALDPAPVGFARLSGSGHHVGIRCATVPAARGRGLAVEGLSALLRAMPSHGMHTAGTQIPPDELASIRLVRAAGFTEQPGTRSHRVFTWSLDPTGLPPPAHRLLLDPDRSWAWDVYAAAMRDSTVALYGTWSDQGRDAVDYAVAHGSRVIQVDRPVGWFLVRQTDSHTLFLEHLYIAPEHQGRGYGTRLVRSLQHRASEANQHIELSVIRTNPRALALYERLGFRVGRREVARYHLTWEQPRHRRPRR